MQIRKKTLRLIGLLFLAACILLVILLWIHPSGSEKTAEPNYTTLLSQNTASEQITEITVTNMVDGKSYIFTDESEKSQLLDALQDIHLYREESDGNPTSGQMVRTTVSFGDTAVDMYISSGYCTNGNGTTYNCADSTSEFMDLFQRQVALESYDRIEDANQNPYDTSDS